jgi:hypothetical protein
MSRDSSVGIVSGDGVRAHGSVSGRGSNFSFLHNVQIFSGAHPASSPMDTEGSFLGVKASGA